MCTPGSLHLLFCFWMTPRYGWPYSILKIWMSLYIHTNNTIKSLCLTDKGVEWGVALPCVVWTFCGSDLSSLSSVKKRFLTDWKRVWASTPRTSAYRSAIMWMFSVFGPLWSLLTNATNKKIIGIYFFKLKAGLLKHTFSRKYVNNMTIWGARRLWM